MGEKVTILHVTECEPMVGPEGTYQDGTVKKSVPDPIVIEASVVDEATSTTVAVIGKRREREESTTLEMETGESKVNVAA